MPCQAIECASARRSEAERHRSPATRRVAILEMPLTTFVSWRMGWSFPWFRGTERFGPQGEKEGDHRPLVVLGEPRERPPRGRGLARVMHDRLRQGRAVSAVPVGGRGGEIPQLRGDELVRGDVILAQPLVAEKEILRVADAV